MGQSRLGSRRRLLPASDVSGETWMEWEGSLRASGGGGVCHAQEWPLQRPWIGSVVSNQGRQRSDRCFRSPRSKKKWRRRHQEVSRTRLRRALQAGGAGLGSTLDTVHVLSSRHSEEHSGCWFGSGVEGAGTDTETSSLVPRSPRREVWAIWARSGRGGGRNPSQTSKVES